MFEGKKWLFSHCEEFLEYCVDLMIYLRRLLTHLFAIMLYVYVAVMKTLLLT